jgi:hypothetical protein
MAMTLFDNAQLGVCAKMPVRYMQKEKLAGMIFES